MEVRSSDGLERAVDRTIEALTRLEVSLDLGITDDTRESFMEQMEEIATCLQEVHQLKDSSPGFFPTEAIFQFVDKGISPEHFSTQRQNEALLAEQRRAGQLEAIKNFHQALKKKMEENITPIPRPAAALSRIDSMSE